MLNAPEAARRGVHSAVSEGEADRFFARLTKAGTVALAVSGGADSLALLWLAAGWQRRTPSAPGLLVLAVDHGLRPNSGTEIEMVAAAASGLGLGFRKLSWEGEKPAAGIEEKARDARYRLLSDASLAAGASHLVTAHHRDDQAETVLMRLARGSGISGLGAMQSETQFGSGLILYRPFLGVPKSRLLATALAAGLRPVEDETNDDPRFARTRLRRLAPALAAEGLDSARLAATAAKMTRAAQALDFYALRLLETIAKTDGKGTILEAGGYRAAPAEARLRALSRSLAIVGRTGRPIRLERLEAVDAAICGGNRFKRTLAGTIVEGRGEVILLRRELGRKR